jgi:TolB-like protein/Flp pilus assembly protein TadD
MSADAEQEYFSDGLTEELLNALAQVPELRVAARTSSFAFKGKNVPVADIARSLNVTTVLEGSVRKAGNQVRITAQLIDAASGHHLWSQTYDRELNDIFAIQEEISRSITDALKIELGTQASDALAAHATANIEAYNLFLQARHFWNKRSPEGINRSKQLLERAIELDPKFARAHAALADVYIVGMEYADFPIATGIERGHAAAMRAIELDSTLAEPYASLGQLAERSYDWDAANTNSQRAIDLNPNYATAYQWRSWHLLYAGDGEGALRMVRKALELDPLSQIINLNLAEHLIYLGRYDEAIAQLNKLTELDPEFTMAWNDLAWVYALKGDIATAMKHVEHLLAMPGTRSGYELGTAGYVLARAGDTTRANALVKEMERRGLWTGAATAYLGMNDVERALDASEVAVRVKEPMSLSLLTPDPVFDPIRKHARFQAIVRSMK